MIKKKCLDVIGMFTHETISEFNDLEISIYNCILKNKSKISHMKIKDLADEAHVSTATILRFCKKLGCEGYSEFKLRYREYLNQEQVFQTDSEETTLKGFVSRIDSREFRESIEDAFSILKDSNRILLIGIGTSGILAKYGARFFSNVGRFSLYVDDPYLPILQDMTDDTVTIALSESGITQQTVNLAVQLKERGSVLISITNNSTSTLAKIADHTISYHVPEILINQTNITTQVPVLYILETLARQFIKTGGLITSSEV